MQQSMDNIQHKMSSGQQLPRGRDAALEEKTLDLDHTVYTSEVCPHWQGQQSDKHIVTM